MIVKAQYAKKKWLFLYGLASYLLPQPNFQKTVIISSQHLFLERYGNLLIIIH
jgi:hypothetical protein